MLYMTRKKVVTCPTQSSLPNLGHKANPVAGILGIVSLIAGVAIFATGRRTPGETYRRVEANTQASKAAARYDARVDRSEVDADQSSEVVGSTPFRVRELILVRQISKPMWWPGRCPC